MEHLRNSLGPMNSIMVSEGGFKWNQINDPHPSLDMTVVYVDSRTGDTYGSCVVKGSLLSEGTINTFMDFIRMAEGDFSSILSEGRPDREVGPSTITSETETTLGLGEVQRSG